MRAGEVVLRVLVLSSALLMGCLPSRVAVSPDGRTLYFALDDEAEFEVEESCDLYALDVETGRLKALTDAPGSEYFCDLSTGGDLLIHMAGEPEEWPEIRVLDLAEGRTCTLAGAVSPLLYPRVVPGDRARVLGYAKGPDDEPRWGLYDLAGGEPEQIGLPLPDDLKASLGNVAVAWDRFAVATHRELEPLEDSQEAQEKEEVAVYVVDLAGLTASEGDEEEAGQVGEARATLVVRWEFEDEPSFVDLAFTPDGKRLVAAIEGRGEKGGKQTVFYELDPQGKEPPRTLFADEGAYYPQWTPDGRSIVYLRDRGKEREVVIRPVEAAEPVVVARLPGKMGQAYTTWKWMEGGRLRIYHVSGKGVQIVERGAAGSGTTARLLPRERLRVLKHVADVRRWVERCPEPGSDWPEAFAEKMKAVHEPLEKAGEPMDRALRDALDAAMKWEDVPAIPELQEGSPEADEPAGEKPVERAPSAE